MRDRALRMVAEVMAEDPRLSVNAVVKRIGPKVGIVPDTLRGWVKRQRVDAGQEPGTTSADAKRIKDLETEVRVLRRANEILPAARAGRAVAEINTRGPRSFGCSPAPRRDCGSRGGVGVGRPGGTGPAGEGDKLVAVWTPTAARQSGPPPAVPRSALPGVPINASSTSRWRSSA